MVSTEAPIRAGLIFQQAERAQQLKQSLRDAGIDLTLELDVQGLRNQGLEDDRVEVYIVNLESEIEDMLDEVTELLDATDRPVVYNDADVSSDLSGWDQARWARHLAAKIRKERGTLPPTPAGAESIPAPKLRATTPVVAPGLASPSTASDPATSSELAVEAAAVSSSSLAASLLALDAEAPPEARESAPAEPASEEQPPTLELPVDLLTDPMIEASTDSPPPDLGWALEDVPTESDEPAPVFEMDEVVPEAPASITPDASLTEGLDLDFQTDSESPEPGLATDGAIADEFESDFLDSAVDDLPDTDEPTDGDTLVIGESLDLSLDLPVDADALDLGDGSLEPVDALDDLSMFGPADEGSDLLEAIDDLEATPAGEVDELDSLFGDIDDASTESSELLDDESMDLPQALLAGELGELEAPGEDAKTEAQEEIAPDLDALFDGAIESDGTASMDEPAKGNSATERSPGLSLPDISQWVLEPLDEEPNEMDALGSGIEPVSTGLDLRGLDSNTPVAPAPAPPTPAVATPAPNEASAPVANLDLDLGLDFSDMDLAPELESEAQSPPVAAAPAAASLSAATASHSDDDGPGRVVILGASIGGPDSIRSYLKAIAPDLKAAFVLVQHMGAEFLELMAQQLDRVTPLQVHLASHGARLKEGEVLVAPVGKRLKFDSKTTVDLSQDAGSTAYSPSIDQVLSDSLERWGASRLLVIIFSGMANDAVAGARQLAEAGVPIWAQDPASCVISSMVDGVVAAKVVSFIGTPEQLAEQTNRLLA